MGSVILADAAQKITRFNEIGLHYNLVANQIYKKRFAESADHFAESFLPYIIAGLISFDMGRGGMMGDKPYELEDDSFALRLRSKLKNLSRPLKPLISAALTQINLQEHCDVIIKSYNSLSAGGEGALHERGLNFHVGTTKILHFLNPRLFIIIDSNAARAFKMAHPSLPFKNTTQPGYSAELYIKCMEHARKDILEYGLESFQALEPRVPITGIYDKLTFITGSRKEARLQ